jgi:recombination protein RecA
LFSPEVLMSAAHDVEGLLAQLGSLVHLANAPDKVHALALAWPELDALLPDGGLPRGVVELAAPHARGGATSVALAAVRAGQARGKGAWCAWIDPEGSLHAPGVIAAGVELARLLVVRAPRAGLPRAALKAVASGAFEVVAIDLDAPPRAEMLVRKLALAAEPSGATVLLLTDSTRPRAAPWPVALRLELSRPDVHTLSVRVAKDRRARVAPARVVPFPPVACLPLADALADAAHSPG